MRAWLGALLALAVPGFAALGADRGAIEPGGPRRVALSSLRACDAQGKVLVRWETEYERGVLGYDLFREANGQWTKVNQLLLAAQDTKTGGRYHQLDPAASAPGPHRYRLEARLSTGGTAILDAALLTADEKTDGQDLAPQLSQPRIPVKVQLPEPEPEEIAPSRGVGLKSGGPVNLANPASQASVKIVTTRPARLCFVSEESLATLLGHSTLETIHGWITANPSPLGLFNRDQQVTFIPGTGYLSSSKPTAPGFYFYAEANIDNYTYRNVYWLRAGSNTYTAVDNGAPTVAPSTDYYWAVYDQEVDRTSITGYVFEPEADYYMIGMALSGSTTPTWTSDPFLLYKVIKTEGLNATLKVRVHGASDTTHLVEMKMNGTLLGRRSFPEGIGSAVLEFIVPANTLLDYLVDSPYENKLTVEEVSSPAYSRVYIDGFELTYPRLYHSTAGVLEASDNGHANISATEFYTYPPTVYDVTNPKVIRPVSNVVNDQPLAGGPYRTTFKTSANSRYLIFQHRYNDFYVSSRPYALPTSVSLVYPQNLGDPATRASYVVITVPSLAVSASQMVAYRSTGLTAFRTKVVLLDDIYNEFSYGLATPHAIEAFLQAAFLHWAIPPRYVLLLGDGTYDYRNVSGKGGNLVPPLMIRTADGLETSDSLFGNVLNDGVPRVFVGRIPVTADTGFQAVLAKIQQYESVSVSAPLRALLAADRPDAAGDFVASILDIADMIDPVYDTNRIYYPLPYPVGGNPPPVDPAPVKAGIVNALNAGVDLMEYVGHGAATQLGLDQIRYFTVADVATLAQNARLPIMAVMTCVVGDYSVPGTTSVAEAMLTTAGRGAAAVLAPTGLSYNADAQWINRRLVQQLVCNTSGRLGDLVGQSFALYNDGAPRQTPVWMYNILGDPAMKVRVGIGTP